MKEKIKLVAKLAGKDRTLNEVLKDRGIVANHPSLGFFHFIYSPIEEANLNGVRLAEKAVVNSIQQLRMTQCNPEHTRENCVGSIVDAWVNTNDEIEIVIAFFKNIFPEMYNDAVELANKDKLFVSFELTTDPDTVEILSDGTKRVHNISWEGVGILLSHDPAYPNARILESANRIVNKVFNKSNEIVFASAKDVVNKLQETSKEIEILFEKHNGGNNLMDEKAKKALFAKIKESIIAELGEEATKNWTEEQFEAKHQENVQVEEQAKKDKENQTAEVQNRKTVETRVYDVKEDTEAGTMEVVETITTQREVDGKIVEDEKIVRNTLYTYAKMEAEINKAKEEVKAEYEAKLKVKDEELKAKSDVSEFEKQISAKDVTIAEKDKAIAEANVEIQSLMAKVEFYKTTAKQIAEIRAELGDFVKDLTDEQLLNEDKIKIARLNKQIDELQNKNSSTPEVTLANVTPKEKQLPTGHNDNSVADDQNNPEQKQARKAFLKAKTGQK